MAREKGSVRIGPVSVFALVVILGLAVLAVLSAATAHASYTEAQAQADFTRSAYVNDAAAAQALADIDAALAKAASAREVTTVDAEWGDADATAAMSAENAEAENDSGSTRGEQGAANAEQGAANAEQGAESAASPAAESSAASAPDLDAAMAAVSAVLPQGQVADGCTAESSVDGASVYMTFSTEDGRTLDVELTVRNDFTYSLERWAVTTAWNQEPEETKLWQSS